MKAPISDSYLTLEKEQMAMFRDRGSKFIGYAFPMKDMDAFNQRIGEIKKEHPKARHFCYAYVGSPDDDEFRYNDDGEPGGSAGLPILNQLKSNNLFRVAVVVVRYFGGKKLGVPGLINAYKTAAKDALNQAPKLKKVIGSIFRISFEYDQTGGVMRVLNGQDLKVIENGYEEKPFVIFSVRRSQQEAIQHKLMAILLNRDLADIVGDEKVPGFNIELIGHNA